MSTKLKSAGACVHASTATELPAVGVEFEVSDDVATELVAAKLAAVVKTKAPAAAPEKE